MTATGQAEGPALDATRVALLDWLDGQRAHVLGIVDGLDDEQLRFAALPSGWTSLEMVSHLTYDVEHYWFACIMGGSPLSFFDVGGDDPRHFWHVEPSTAAADVLQRYRDAIAASNEVIASTDLEAPPRQRSEWWGTWDVHDLRFVMLHVIAETACHAGHLDAVRELIDGRQWVLQ